MSGRVKLSKPCGGAVVVVLRRKFAKKIKIVGFGKCELQA